MDLASNGIIITDAIKYVNGKMEHLNKQEKLLQDIKEDVEAEAESEVEAEEEQQLEQQTHNTVF